MRGGFLIEEYARHNRDVDLIRALTDAITGR